MVLNEPDFGENLTVIGVGGCGKTLLKSICEHDWLLKNFISRGNRLGLYTIDTATNEHNEDVAFMNEIRNHIDSLNTQNLGQGTVSCNHFDLTRMANIQRIEDLTADRVVNKLQRDHDVNPVWWLHDDEHGINFNDLTAFDRQLVNGFGGGVYRMRAVSKAAFTIAYNSGEQQFGDIVNASGGTTAIIVGLGGGTGSGMFIDLAKKIRHASHNRRIYLFAILPSSTEGANEKLNAAIALTELEYLNLHPNDEMGLFTHVILTSLEPTRFVTYETSRTSRDVVEFSDAFPYLFANTFAISHDDVVLNNNYTYGGFAHADSNVFEYPIDKIRDFENKYKSYLEKLKKITSIRMNICNTVKDFFDENKIKYENEYGQEDHTRDPNISDISRYRGEIRWIKSMWESESASNLKLQTPEQIKNILCTYDLNDKDLATLNFKDLKNYVVEIKRQMDSLAHGVNLWDNSADQTLFHCIHDNLHILEIVGECYTKTTCLKESLSQKAHMNVMTIDENNTPIQDRNITEEIKRLTDENVKLNDEINNNKSNIDSLTSEMDGSNEEIREWETHINSVNEQIDKCRTDIENNLNGIYDDLKEYCDYKLKQNNIQNLNNEYSNNIHGNYSKFLKLIENEDGNGWRIFEPNERPTIFPTLSTEKYNPIKNDNHELSVLLDNLDTNVSKYYYWSYSEKVADKKYIRPFKKSKIKTCNDNKTRVHNEIKNICTELNRILKNTYFNYSDDANNTNKAVVTINENPILSIFEDTLKVIIDRIIGKIAVKYTEIDTTKMKTLVEVFKKEGNQTELTRVLVDGILNILDDDNKWVKTIKDLNNKITDKKSGLQEEINKFKSNNERNNGIVETNKSKITYLTSVRGKLISETTSSRLEYTNMKNDLSEPIAEDFSNYNITRTYKSILGTPSLEILNSLTPNSTLDNLEDSEAGKRDVETIIGLLNNRYHQLLLSSMIGINLLRIPTGEPNKVWRLATSGLGISTKSNYFEERLEYIDPETREAISGTTKRNINDCLNSMQNCRSVVHSGAKPWECGISLIVAGNHLENIFGFHRGGAYRVAYDDSKHNILHHVLGLEMGTYITRDLLGDNEATKFAFNEIDRGGNVGAEILALYHEHKLTDAIKDKINPRGI